MTVSNEDIGETEEGLEDGVAETIFWGMTVVEGVVDWRRESYEALR